MANTLARVACIVASPVLISAGSTAWALVTEQLKAQKIDVPADAARFQGRRVAGPITAFTQAEVIDKHALAMAGGRTFSELGAEAMEARKAGETERADQLETTRQTVLQASFLRASLFTSVLAYGVAAMAVGMGVLSGLVAGALPRD